MRRFFCHFPGLIAHQPFLDRDFVRETTFFPEPILPKMAFRSGKCPEIRTNYRRNDTLFGKPPFFPNEISPKRHSVRENAPKSEPTAEEMILCSGNYPFSRTNFPKNGIPFGKSPRNPNQLPNKWCSVRESTLFPEPTSPKKAFRSGNHPEIRTDGGGKFWWGWTVGKMIGWVGPVFCWTTLYDYFCGLKILLIWEFLENLYLCVWLPFRWLALGRK